MGMSGRPRPRAGDVFAPGGGGSPPYRDLCFPATRIAPPSLTGLFRGANYADIALVLIGCGTTLTTRESGLSSVVATRVCAMRPQP